MQKTLIITLLTALTAIHHPMAAQDKARIRLNASTLMHEMRATPFPTDKAVIKDRAVSFQWPLQADLNAARYDSKGKISKADKKQLRYKLRYSQDPTFKKKSVTVETRWPFFNPEQDLGSGVWYWQFGYVANGKTEWANIQQFTVKANSDKFCPPNLKVVLAKLPKSHPRVYLEKSEWDSFMTRNKGNDDYKKYIQLADKALQTPMKSVSDINTNLLKGLDSEMKRDAMLTRESRRIVDKEEENTDALIRAYMLTKDRRYADEALKRVKEMISWSENKNIKGDFNEATFALLTSLAYDAFYDILDANSKQTLLNCLRKLGSNMYDHYNNRLENHIADNHVWQMTLRIFTMVAFTAYGEVPEADTWVDYCYNLWVARFPGLNKDGAWHNGDSYFHVNIRTLVEVPQFYTRITGFNYFSDPWYQGNAMYVIYQQPPFSKSGGNGSSHQNVLKPSGSRVSYADAIAKMTGNTYLADYVRRIQAKQTDILSRESTGKAGGLAWFRLLCDKPLPQGPGLKEMPMGYVFPASGLASFSTNLDRLGGSAMFSFRSSPYGSTSHAIANQNAFNTFWSGQPLFYSSGHHIAFTDKHSMLCHRATRGHNTILVNGMGQRIGTEGYGWIPRYYISEKVGYLLGDASNAYGKVTSPQWIKRAKDANVELSPENGWDNVPLKTFRRHIVQMGKSGYTFIYDELEAEEPVNWSYLLHTITNPMTVDTANPAYVRIQATSKNGISDAYLFSAGKLQTETTDKFFVPAVNWLRADDKGNFKKYPNHWHFSATTDKQKVYRFATLIHTHIKKKEGETPVEAPAILKDGRIRLDDWVIIVNLTPEGKPSFTVRKRGKGVDVKVEYNGDATIVREDGYETTLIDKMPELEI